MFAISFVAFAIVVFALFLDAVIGVRYSENVKAFLGATVIVAFVSFVLGVARIIWIHTP